MIEGLTGYIRAKVAHCKVTIEPTDYVIAHGASKFITNEKLAKLQLQKKSHPGIDLHLTGLYAKY